MRTSLNGSLNAWLNAAINTSPEAFPAGIVTLFSFTDLAGQSWLFNDKGIDVRSQLAGGGKVYTFSGNVLQPGMESFQCQTGSQDSTCTVTFMPLQDNAVGFGLDQLFIAGCHSGLFDGAYMTIDYGYYFDNHPTSPIISVFDVVRMYGGWVGKIDMTRDKITIELNSILFRANIRTPKRMFAAPCQHALYDRGCAPIINRGVPDTIGGIPVANVLGYYLSKTGSPAPTLQVAYEFYELETQGITLPLMHQFYIRSNGNDAADNEVAQFYWAATHASYPPVEAVGTIGGFPISTVINYYTGVVGHAPPSTNIAWMLFTMSKSKGVTIEQIRGSYQLNHGRPAVDDDVAILEYYDFFTGNPFPSEKTTATTVNGLDTGMLIAFYKSHTGGETPPNDGVAFMLWVDVNARINEPPTTNINATNPHGPNIGTIRSYYTALTGLQPPNNAVPVIVYYAHITTLGPTIRGSDVNGVAISTVNAFYISFTGESPLNAETSWMCYDMANKGFTLSEMIDYFSSVSGGVIAPSRAVAVIVFWSFQQSLPTVPATITDHTIGGIGVSALLSYYTQFTGETAPSNNVAYAAWAEGHVGLTMIGLRQYYADHNNGTLPINNGVAVQFYYFNWVGSAGVPAIVPGERQTGPTVNNYTVHGYVTAVDGTYPLQTLYTSIYDASSAYVMGFATFSGGLNANLRKTIKFTAGNLIILMSPLPNIPNVGDGISLTQGCDKSTYTCLNKFGNLNNFGGFPWIPQESVFF